MATGGEENVGYSLVSVRTLTLEDKNKKPFYFSIVVYQDNIFIIDFNEYEVQIFRLHDGKSLVTSDKLHRPRDMCLMDTMNVCVVHEDGVMKVMSIDSTDTSRVLKTTRTIRLHGALETYHGVVKYKDNLVVSGVKQGTMYWCIVSFDDGHVDTIHQICKGCGWSSVTTKDNLIYISCHAGDESPDTGVYGFDILNPSQCKYTYKHKRLQWPASIVINEEGNIFVCNGGGYSCIHQLTASCQLVAIFTKGIPSSLRAIFWDYGHLYVTCDGSRDITVFTPMYKGRDKASDVKMSTERKQPITEETTIEIGKGNVYKGKSRRERAMPSAVQVPEDTENRQIIPAEVLNMDAKSLEMYKQALRDGKEKVYNIRVMVVGQFGVGKTTLTKRLLGRDVNISERKSTEGIDIHMDCCKVTLGTGEWITQEKSAVEYSRLQRLVKLLSIQKLESGAKKETPGERGNLFSHIKHTDTGIPKVHPKQAKKTPRKPVSPPSRKRTQRSIKLDKRPSKVQSDESKSNLDMPASKEVSGENEKKKDAMLEILQLVNKHVEKLEKSIVEHATMGVWDFAGQCVFYTTHQSFLTSRAIYLLVIDLHQQVTDLIKDDHYFHDTEGLKLCKVHDLIEIWMNSIHTCETPPASGIPPVILVGTHVDKIPKKSQKKVINEYFLKIRYMLREKPALRHLMDDIAIDNTQCDPKLEELKRKIFDLASKQPHWGEEKPARWLPLEQAMMTLKASGTKVVPLSLIEEINKSGSVKIKDRDELYLFLRFHHEIGTILYFNVEGLREKIVLDPQWLIDALKSLITAEKFMRKNPAIIKWWCEFKGKGKLTQELIDGIWTKEKNPEFHDNKDHILLLMEKLNIIAKPRLYSEDGKEIKVENYYLAPCMLNEKAPEEVICPKPHPEMESSSVLSYAFKEKFLPAPIFHRLLAACVAKWPISKKKKSENLIYCGCGVFDLDLHNRLMVFFREYIIFAQVTRFGTKERTFSLKQCIEVREFISMTLSNVIGGLGQNLQFELFVRCPKSDGDDVDCLTPVSDLQKNVDVPCHFHEQKSSHLIISREVLKFWFHEGEIQERTGVSCSDPELLCQVLKKSTQVASSSRSTLEGNCETVGLKFHGETPSNGNCFFEAVSSQLQRLNCAVKRSPQQLRLDVVAFMKSNTVLQVSEGTINLAEFISNGNFNDYCERMALDGEWADHVVVVGMARMLQMDIMIVTSAPSSVPDNIIAWVVGQTNFNRQPILLGHIWENHYMSLQPIDHEVQERNEGKQPVMEETATQTEQEAEHSEDGSSAVPMPPPPSGDTDRFMRLTYLLVDVGSRILRQLLIRHTVTPSCTLDQYLAKNRSTLNSLLKRKVLHQPQMDILFPPNRGNTNIDDYDVTLLSTLFNNVVPSLTQQEKDMIKSLREDRNKLYGHAKSCKMNAIEYHTCWNSISSTLITLSQQCGDPNFQNEISQEIQRTKVSAIPSGCYLDILKTWFCMIETVKGSLQTTEGELQALKARVESLESKKTAEESDRK